MLALLQEENKNELKEKEPDNSVGGFKVDIKQIGSMGYKGGTSCLVETMICLHFFPLELRNN